MAQQLVLHHRSLDHILEVIDFKRRRVNSKAVQQLSQLFVQYEPQLLRAGDNPADVSPDKLRAAVALMNSAKKIVIENNLLDFVPLALGQLFRVLNGHKDMQEMLERLKQSAALQLTSAIAETAQKYKAEAEHQQQSAAKEVADLKAQKVYLQALLDATILREIDHLRWNFVYTKHNKTLSQALRDAELRDAKSTQQLSAAKRQIMDIKHELQDSKAESADVKMQLSAEVDQRRRTDESLVNVKAELQKKTEQLLSTEHEAKCVKAELMQAEANDLKDSKAESADLKVQLSAEVDQRRRTEESLVNVKAELQKQNEQLLSTEHEAKCVKAELMQAEAKLLNDLKELQQQLAAEKQLLANAEKEHLQDCKELQSALEAQQRDFAREKEAGMAAADQAASREVQLEAAGRAACTLHSQLTAVQQDLAAEQQRHQAAQQTAATLELELQAMKQEVQQQLAAEKQRLATAENELLQQHTELQAALEAERRELAGEKQAGMAFADRAASLEAQLEAAGGAACTLQSQLAAVQQDLAAEQQRHQAAQQTVVTLELQLQNMKQLADTLPAEVPNSHPQSASAEVPSRRPQEHPQGADTPAGSLSQAPTRLLVQSGPACSVANDVSGVEAQSVEHMSVPLVVPHTKLLAVNDRGTLERSATKAGSGSLIKAQVLESLASPAHNEALIVHAPRAPNVTPAIVDPALTPTANADSLAPPVDGKSAMGGVASEPFRNKHCTAQAGVRSQAPSAQSGTAAQADPPQADVGSQELPAHADVGAQAGPHQAPYTPPAGPHVPASKYWHRIVKVRQSLQGETRKKALGKMVFEAVPACPAFFWATDDHLRLIGSGGQGAVNYVQQWWLDGGKPKTRAAAMKVVSYQTPMQMSFFHREEANLRAPSSRQPDGRNQIEPYAPAFHAAFVDPEGTPNRQGKLIMGLVEGECLMDYIDRVTANTSAKQRVDIVATTIRKVLLVLSCMHNKQQRTFGDVKPENLMMVGKTVKFVDWSSSLVGGQEAIGALATLGYPSPEATAPGHPKRPSCPLGRHKDDVHAVGVMGLLFLSPESRMPFGPSKGQWDRVQRDPTALQEVKKSVISNHKAWEAAYPGTADGDWPATFSHLLKMVPEGSQRDKAKSFFAGLLHPNPADRLTAAQAFEHRFVKQS
ncbi:hypothetical protein ABBQ38_005017 [Trebouxia sp. C0009 RCD-2024]